MKIPSATYRLQFSPLFRFTDARELLDYLKTLGVGGIYASPVFKARPGSTHGYDIIDPASLNPELGTAGDFDVLTAAVKARGLVWLQDIVPNHVAYSGENVMMMDVLEKGRGSKFFDFFDIDWNYPYENTNGKVLAPFLGKFYGETLQSGELALKYDEQGLSINYYGLRFPLKMESYVKVFSFNLGRLKHDLGADHPDFIKLLGILYTLKNLPSAEELRELYDHIGFVKKLLWDLYRKNESVRRYIDQSLKLLNGKPGQPDSYDHLDSLLSEQYYRLSFWKVASEELNYRRFFNINDLISLKVENAPVFEYVHSLIFALVREGKAEALRIDHIDGLYDPLGYLRALREKLGDLYIVVEKILAYGEELPSSWPVQGTTGYDFLNHLNCLFCDRANEELFNRIYRRAVGYELRYDNLVFEKKRLIIGKYMAGDIDELARLIKQFISRERDGIDITMYGLKRALVDVLALFPVYRTYLSGEMTSERDLSVMRRVIEAAKEVNPGLMNELNLIGRFLLLDIRGNEPAERKKEWLHIVMRFQQYTGPLMAKGFEDTALYVYNRLLSLNEVGGEPGKFGITPDEFHSFNWRRAVNWPHSMNATSTHDTKRGEDARARINVLSEIPAEWRRNVKSWSRFNASRKKTLRGRELPSRNDEYFFYQTLVGSFPLDPGELSAFTARVKEYVIKAVREAKIYTAWLKPDEEYESAFLSFIDAVLCPGENNAFLNEFMKFQKRVSPYGMLNSLSQVLVKITSPGVPDFYQGTELWDFSMVDPDNRRPVDFAQRKNLLSALIEREKENAFKLLNDLLEHQETGAIKLFLTFKALNFRNDNLDLFLGGDYHPVEVRGRFRQNVIAFAREKGGAWAITVAPRLCTQVFREGEFKVGKKAWEDTVLVMPAALPAWKEVITLQSLPGERELSLNEVLKYFPVALLTGS